MLKHTVVQGELHDPLGHGLPPKDFDFGGMSGGPMLAVIETGLISWALAGVITDAGSMLGGTLFAGAQGDPPRRPHEQPKRAPPC